MPVPCAAPFSLLQSGRQQRFIGNSFWKTLREVSECDKASIWRQNPIPAAAHLKCSANTRMYTKSILSTLVLAATLFGLPKLFGQEKARNTLPDDPAKAWAEVEKVHQALRPPDDWRAQPPTSEQVAEFRKQVRQTAVSFADKAREFIVRF